MSSLALKIPLHDDEPALLEAEESLFDMANLSEKSTGIPGFIYVSTRQGQHGPRIKYFKKLGPGQPNLSVAINSLEIVEDTLSHELSAEIRERVQRFALLNREQLLAFWHEGLYWPDEQVQGFKAGLLKA